MTSELAPFDPDEIARQFGEEPPSSAGAEITAPSFTAEQGVYLYSLGAPAFVSLSFDQVRGDREGGLAAEVTARSTAPGLERTIVIRGNLTGPRGRKELATHLAERIRGPVIDWADVVERATSQVVQAYRAGEPAMLLRDAPEPIDSGYLIKPLLVARQPTIWFGDGGSGKSLLALAAALTVHGSRADLLSTFASAQLRVGYVDYEYDAWEHRQRMRSLLPAGEELPDLPYIRCALPIREEFDRLRQFVRDFDVQYLVVDSVAPACGGEPESAEVALSFFQTLRRLGVGSLCIAHTTKNPEAQERPFGSAFWHNMARSSWLVRKQQEPSSTSLAVGLFNKKANAGPLSSPLGFELLFGEDHIAIRRTDVRDNAELATGVSIRYRIEHALKTGFRSIAELASELDESADSISKTLRRHEGKTFVRAPLGADKIQRWGVLAS